MSEIPPEAQAAIDEFNRQETTGQAARLPHQKRKARRAEEAGSRPGPMTAEEVISLAKQKGWGVETGGRHLHLVKGKQSVSVPVHGGSDRKLATGTRRRILEIITGE